MIWMPPLDGDEGISSWKVCQLLRCAPVHHLQHVSCAIENFAQEHFEGSCLPGVVSIC
jgi:hypothetical protein